MFISGGENVYPAEIERVLRKHQAVEDIAVVGFPDETWGEVGYAFVIPKTGTDLKSEDLISFCEGQLARYKWPKKILFARDFPRTALGKVRKTELRKQYMEKNG
jgi:fatty-acyl-CoA synthase